MSSLRQIQQGRVYTLPPRTSGIPPDGSKGMEVHSVLSLIIVIIIIIIIIIIDRVDARLSG